MHPCPSREAKLQSCRNCGLSPQKEIWCKQIRLGEKYQRFPRYVNYRILDRLLKTAGPFFWYLGTNLIWSQFYDWIIHYLLTSHHRKYSLPSPPAFPGYAFNDYRGPTCYHRAHCRNDNSSTSTG